MDLRKVWRLMKFSKTGFRRGEIVWELAQFYTFILKITELNTHNEYILWHANYASIKLLVCVEAQDIISISKNNA